VRAEKIAASESVRLAIKPLYIEINLIYDINPIILTMNGQLDRIKHFGIVNALNWEHWPEYY
jgi:hypothetical protein